MNAYTVSFFGHRCIENALEIERKLEHLIITLLRNKEYVEFLVGRDGEYDQLVSSTIRRCKREYRSDNSANIWVLPYSTEEFGMNFLRRVINNYHTTRIFQFLCIFIITIICDCLHI